MDERLEWEAERNQVIRAQRLADEERTEARADAARMADAEARHDAVWDSARRTGRPVPTHDDILRSAREALDATGDGWNQAAEYGSESRPAMFVSMPDGGQVEVTAKPAGVQRSVSDIKTDELLARARAMQGDTFMAVQIARFHQRHRSGVSRAEASVSRYGEQDGGYPVVISR